MLAFQTDFPVSTTCSPQDFLRTLSLWLSRTDHSGFTPAALGRMLDMPQGSLRSERAHDSEYIEWLAFSSEELSGAGLRHQRPDPAVCGLLWTSTLVFSATPDGGRVSIRVEHDGDQPQPPQPPILSRTVPLIPTLIDTLGGGEDGSLTVSTQPRMLGESEVDLVSKLMRTGHGGRLPVVYASLPFAGIPGIDTHELARQLAGIAHVLIEPGRQFSHRLKLAVNGRNVYGGTLGIYWPDDEQHDAFYLGTRFARTADLTRALIARIHQDWLRRDPLPHGTWAGLREACTYQTIRQLKASGSLDLGEYIEKFDAEITAKDEKIRELEEHNQQLRTALKRQESLQTPNRGSLLDPGREQNLYPDEILGVILDALGEALSRSTRDSRREHILQSLIDANPIAENHAQLHQEHLKNLLRGMRGMTPKIRRDLEDMGFSVDESARHIKIVFRNDDRYTYTLPKSGSDARGGLNAANDIGRLLF